jgi:hypothetical protein
MEMLPSYKAHALPARPVSAQARLEIKSMEISTLMTKSGVTTDEEMELIEMRCRQALAVRNLEAIFAEGLLNCR